MKKAKIIFKHIFKDEENIKNSLSAIINEINNITDTNDSLPVKED